MRPVRSAPNVRTVTTPEPPHAKRWAARIALILVAAAAILVFASAGYTGLFLVVTGLVGAALLLAGMFWFLARRGVTRWIGLVVAALAVVFLIYSYAAPTSPCWRSSRWDCWPSASPQPGRP